MKNKDDAQSEPHDLGQYTGLPLRRWYLLPTLHGLDDWISRNRASPEIATEEPFELDTAFGQRTAEGHHSSSDRAQCIPSFSD